MVLTAGGPNGTAMPVAVPAPPAEAARDPRQGRRPALDGLRAVAIVLVVVYHFGGEQGVLPGGFLGVDVFFVLSGYLITEVLLSTMRGTGRVRLASFWYRRIRRLVPPLLVLCLLSVALVWWAEPPETWPARRGDVVWVLLYLGNWRLLGDHAAGLGPPPLMHTWSLAVEEQFYLVWPLALAAAVALGAHLHRRRLGVRLAAALAGVGVVASVMWTAQEYGRRDAYFGTWGRSAELLAGALLALGAPRIFRSIRGPRARWLGGVGWVALALTVATVRFDSPWYYQGGTVVVSADVVAILVGLEAGQGGRAVRALSTRPAVALGRISYGVYLFHHLVMLYLPVPSSGVRAAAADQLARVLVTLGLAVLCYLAIERPLLAGAVPWIRRSPRRLVGAVVVAAVATLAVSDAATALPGDLDVQLRTAPPPACAGETVDHPRTCSPRDAGTGAVWLVAGDATALSLAGPLAAVGRAGRFSVVRAAWPECDGPWAPSAEATGESLACSSRAGQVLDAAMAASAPAALVVAAGVQGRDATPDPRPAVTDADTRRDLLALVDGAARHGTRTVFVAQPPPDLGLGALVASGRPAGSWVPSAVRVDAVARYDRDLAAVVAQRPTTALLIDVSDVVCPGGVCSSVLSGVLVRAANGGYTQRFATGLAPVLAARIAAALRSASPSG